MRDLWIFLTLVGLIAVSQLLLAPKGVPLVAGVGRGGPWFCNKNAPALLEYGRRFRTGFGFQVRAMCAQDADLIKKFKSGGYAGKQAEFEADTTAFCKALEESSEQFDGQHVPEQLERSHAKISGCHRLCYQSVQTLRLAYQAQGAERLRLTREAEKQMHWAWVTGQDGVKLHKQIWDRLAR